MAKNTQWVVAAMLVLSACSGDGGSGGRLMDGGDLDASLDGSQSEGMLPPPGTGVDLNGDGIPDGTAVDTNGDGISDGVDTDGNGTVDQPLPTTPTGDSGTGTPTAPVPTVTPFMCGDVVCQCSDGKDNDGDGRGDLADPECVAAWDNDEDSFATGQPGDNRDDACQDCFFDGNSGSGNDGCRLPTSCLTEGNASSGHGSCSSCEQTDMCKNFCKAYTPNGCDCFGCCGVKLPDGSTKNILIGGGCDIEGSTTTGCTECVPNDSCVNTCGRCELCPGKTVADLPADCTPPPPASQPDAGTPPVGSPDGGTTNPPPPPPPPPPSYTCDNGEALCGTGLPDCGADYACTFGCCVLTPVILF
ncbi:MAG: hypothetical protein QM778_34275 [Myxococcales bacterium]